MVVVVVVVMVVVAVLVLLLLVVALILPALKFFVRSQYYGRGRDAVIPSYTTNLEVW